MDQPVALGLELVGSRGDVGDLELDAGLRHGNLTRPFRRPEAGCCRLRERPKSEVLRPAEALGVHVVASTAFERKAECVHVKGVGCTCVSYDRGDARYELDIRSEER